MKQLVSRLFHYLRVHRHMLSFALKYMMEYRVNFLVRSLHNITYVAIFLIVTFIIYSHTTTLGGWTKNEAILLYSLVHITYGTQLFLFMRGVEEFMRLRVKSGDFDLDLVKPLNSQFITFFRTPWVDSIVFTIILSGLFIRQLVILKSQIPFANIFLFMIAYFLCLMIWYFMIASFASISFHITKSEQIIYFIEKASDFAQYPTNIFPKGVQLAFFSLLPIAFVAYIPGSILLGKNSQFMWLLILIALPTSFIINKIAWREGLKHYSSASS